jgi:hypothetical protein
MRAAVGVYAALTAVQLSIALVLWLTEHHAHPVTTASAAIVTVGLLAVWSSLVTALVRGRRWAWFVLTGLAAFGLISYAWGSGRILFLAFQIPALALLLSPPLRQYVGGARLSVSALAKKSA